MTKSLIALAILIAACQPASKPAAVRPTPLPPTASSSPVVVHPPTPATDPLPEPKVNEELTVVSATMPPKLVLDGYVEEWAHDEEPPSTRTVYVAVDANKLVIASSVQTVSVALSTPVPAVPDIGWIVRGGFTHELTDETCVYEQVNAPEASYVNGKKQPPEVIKACRAILQRHNDFKSKQNERFVRRFRLTSKGIEALDASGNASPIEGAAHFAKPDGGVEVQLPITAMPRLGQSPLSKWLAVVATGNLPDALMPPTKDHAKGWTELKIVKPVSFGPYGTLENSIYADFKHASYGMSQLSFHPSKTDSMEIIHAPYRVSSAPGALPRPSVVTEERVLYTPVEELGRIKVGLANAHAKFLVTYRDGVLLKAERFTDVRGTQRRGDHLHVFAFSPSDIPMGISTYVPPRWKVLAVDELGGLTHVADEGVDMIGFFGSWDKEPKPFNDKDFKRFGVIGMRNKRSKVVTWNWDEKKGQYLSSVLPKDAAGTYNFK